MRGASGLRRALLSGAVLLLAWSAVVRLTGGVNTHIAGIALRSRGFERPLVAGLALLAIAAFAYREAATHLLDRVVLLARRFAAALSITTALLLAGHAVVFGTFVVSGSDSFGYVNQAYDWRAGDLPGPLVLRTDLPFETADLMQVPLGYRAGIPPHTMVPTYAPGLPLLMAVALAGGAWGPFVVTPICAALFVWFTFRLGALAAGKVGGVLAAVLLATSPVVLFQALWPMSDVPVGALWTGALLYALGGSRRTAFAAGALAALALLVRPNLLFVPLVPMLAILWSAVGRERWLRAALFVLPMTPVVAGVAWLNTVWYGAPSHSGYGAPGELYQLANVWPNIRLYTTWLWQSQPAWLLLPFAALVVCAMRGVNRPVVAICAVMLPVTFASYVSYAQFEDWWYLRFLLPALGAFAVVVSAALVALSRRLSRPWAPLTAAIAATWMVVTALSFASDKGIFGIVQAAEHRYLAVATFVDVHLPSDAMLIAVQHSGSLRFYTGRQTLRFDWIYPQWAGGVPAALEKIGHHPYLVIDDWEMPQVRRQFGLAADAPLPWPTVARMREVGGVTVFDLATHPDASPPVALEPGAAHFAIGRRPLI